MYSYALNRDATNTIYVSWNGATTVTTWRFYGAQSVGEGFATFGNKTKNGVETTYTADKHYPWVMVEAVAW